MAFSGTDLADMNPGESRPVSLTFTLVDSETISSTSWGIGSLGAIDMFAATRLGSTSGTHTGPACSNRVSDLLPGAKYIIECQATCDSGNVYSLYTHVTCRTPT